MDGKIPPLNEEDMKKQEGDYIYRYRYNGGGATQVWLGSGRYSKFRASTSLVSSLFDTIISRFWSNAT